MERRVLPVCCLLALAAAACGGATSSADGATTPPDGASPDGASPGMCGADVPAGQACNTIANVAEPITPTCVSGTLPTGTGGTILDGTYVLTSQTYYQDTSCTKPPLSEMFVLAGGCVQVVFAGGNLTAQITTQGNTFTSTLRCQRIDADGGLVNSGAAQTYTATSTTLAIFSAHTSVDTFEASVFTRR